MLSGEWAEASAREVTIDLPADGFDELLGFCYTGRVSVHKGNVGALLRLSTFLQVRELEELCCGFLLGQPPPGEPSASGQPPWYDWPGRCTSDDACGAWTGGPTFWPRRLHSSVTSMNLMKRLF